MTERLTLPAPDDFHVHLRRGDAMGAYARRHEASFGRALIMPNTVPPISSALELDSYRKEIAAQAPRLGTLMSFKLIPGMGRNVVYECARAGAVAGKYYPAGATTQSSDGLHDPSEVREELDAMRESGLVLCVHAEDPSAPVLEREAAFLPQIDRIRSEHPGLKIVVEHLSSKEALEYVLGGPDTIAGTITAHHLLFTIDDMAGEALNPHLYCKPILKRARDRDALRDAVFRGERRLFFGSDSAPHPRAAKEKRAAASGVYSSPTALCALVELFEREGRLSEFGEFIAANGADFYGIGRPTGRIELARESWTVPEEIDGAVPMLAGAVLNWKISSLVS
jgi:dihydroorotase